MIIKRLGEATPPLDVLLNLLGATVEGEQLVISVPNYLHISDLEYGGGYRPVFLDEVLTLLGVRTVVPTQGIRDTPHGIEVEVQNHYARFHENTWKPPIID